MAHWGNGTLNASPNAVVYQTGAKPTFQRRLLMILTYLNLLLLKTQALLNEQDGQDLIEYALLAVLISVACVAAISPVATAIQTVFSTISSDLS
jgi:pilus assembly protein Flp/PilA